MYELIKAGESTYYIDCPAKMGVYVAHDGGAWLIDSGNDKEAAKKALNLFGANGWTLAGVVNTHSNADHVGGNALLQQRTGCRLVSTGLENAFAKYPVLEPSFLYGGYPCRELRSKFLMATPSEPTGEVESALPEGLSFLRLGGHFFDMVGVKTPDDVWFLADCLFGENIVNKYHLFFVYDTAAFLATLDMLETLQGRLFVPSHAPAVRDVTPLVRLNREKIYEILSKIVDICRSPAGFEEILKQLFDAYSLTMDFSQYVLVGSTVRSHLSYLHDRGDLTVSFEQNRLLYRSV